VGRDDGFAYSALYQLARRQIKPTAGQQRLVIWHERSGNRTASRLVSGIASGPERPSTLGRTVNDGDYALLGADVSHYRDRRRLFGLWRHCLRCSRHRKNTILHLPNCLCRDAAVWSARQKKPTDLVFNPNSARSVASWESFSIRRVRF
jgi:hypothetical protein